MTPTEHQKLVNALTGILRDALSGDQDPAPHDSGMYFEFKGLGGLRLSREESEKMNEAADLLVEAYPRVARKSILNELQRFCCRFISVMEAGSREFPIPHKLPELLNLFDLLQSQSTTVYIQVAGIDLKVDEWVFGPAKFMRGNHPDVDSERLQIMTLEGHVPKPLDPKNVLVQLKLQGEPVYARDHAAERVQEVLDCLQLLSLSENQGSWESPNTGFYLRCCEPIPLVSARIWSFSSKGPTWESWCGAAPIPVTGPEKCIIDKSTSAKFAQRGGCELAQMLAEICPSSFDENLLTATTWLANGIRERDYARKFLSFYVTLEALFSRDDRQLRQAKGFQSPSVPIKEGVAFLLGRTVEARRRLERRISELAETRNRIVHRGFTVIEKSDLIDLGRYAWNSCWQAAIRREFFKEDNSFHEWLLGRKFGNADIVWPEDRGDYVI